MALLAKNNIFMSTLSFLYVSFLFVDLFLNFFLPASNDNRERESRQSVLEKNKSSEIYSIRKVHFTERTNVEHNNN